MAHNENHISVAHLSDAPEIMEYINAEWKTNHILSRDQDFFLYEYASDAKLNFVISRNAAGNINGMLGFIKASAGPDSVIWTTMWKVSKNSGAPMLGIELLEFLRGLGYKAVMSLGINAKTIDIYRYLGFSTGCLRQYVIANSSYKQFELLTASDKIPSINFENNAAYTLEELPLEQLSESFDFDQYNGTQRFKDFAYFEKRFYKHPKYSYSIYGIFHNSNLKAFLVCRVVESSGHSAMRIVDFYGDETAMVYATRFLNQIMLVRGYEYIDLVCFGVNHELLLKAGFTEVDLESESLIVPNYFEPFVKKNIPIHFFVDGPIEESLRFFKADGDQDRPN